MKERNELSTAEFKALLEVPDIEQRISRYAEMTGSVKLSVAENVLLYPILNENIFKKLQIPVEVTKYAARHYGNDSFLTNLKDMFFNLFEIAIKEDNINCVSGVSRALECLGLILSRGWPIGEKNIVLTPAPSWQGFPFCFDRSTPKQVEVKYFPVTEHQMKWADVLNALNALGSNEKPRILLITNPHNPLGINYAKEGLELIYSRILNTAAYRDVHIISDEIYGNSQTTGAEPAFVSAFNLDAYQSGTPEQKARVHVVWGFAKDFGLSGFKAGLIISTNEEVKKQLRNGESKVGMSFFGPMCHLKQHVIGQLFSKVTGSNDLVYQRAMREYPGLLSGARRECIKAIDDVNRGSPQKIIEYKSDSSAAQFFWLDLRKFLGRVPVTAALSDGLDWLPEFELGKEKILFDFIANKAGVTLLPGLALHNKDKDGSLPGFFRLCYTAEKTDDVKKAISDIGAALKPYLPAL